MLKGEKYTCIKDFDIKVGDFSVSIKKGETLEEDLNAVYQILSNHVFQDHFVEDPIRNFYFLCIKSHGQLHNAGQTSVQSTFKAGQIYGSIDGERIDNPEHTGVMSRLEDGILEPITIKRVKKKIEKS